MVPLTAALNAADYKPMMEAGAAIGATRLTVGGGDTDDFSIVADKLAAMAEQAQPYGIAVDLEFMPFRPVKTLSDALDVLKRASHPNAHILIDVLHVFRSKSDIALFKTIDPETARPGAALRWSDASARRSRRRSAHAPPAARRRASSISNRCWTRCRTASPMASRCRSRASVPISMPASASPNWSHQPAHT